MRHYPTQPEFQSLSDRLIAMVRADPWRMSVLQVVRSLDLECWAIGAGVLRNLVWDQLHGHTRPTPLADIDVIIYAPDHLDKAYEQTLEQTLRMRAPDLPWSVKNQARMHLVNQDAPYRDLEDALAHWLETPTAVALRLENDGQMTVLAPYGLEDLFALRLAPTPAGRRRITAYQQRLEAKQWHLQWPKLTIEMLPES